MDKAIERIVKDAWIDSNLTVIELLSNEVFSDEYKIKQVIQFVTNVNKIYEEK